MTSLRPKTLVVVVLLGWAICPHAAACHGAGVPATSTLSGSYVPAVAGHGAIENPEVDNAIAGPLVAALSEQLGDRPVDIRIDAIDVAEGAAAQRDVSGTGSLRIQGDDEWMGFRFSISYDSRFGSTGFPHVSIGGVAADEKDVPNDGRLVQKLDDQVVAAMRSASSGDLVRLQLDTIHTVEAGRRYLRIDATGLADFGREGTSDARIEALYDRFSGQWLRVHYDIGRGPPGSVREVSRDVSLVNR